MAEPTPTQASRRLAESDPVFADLVARHGPPRLRRRPKVDERFEVLARAIAYQQLAGRAAGAIWSRVRALVDGRFDASRVARLSIAELRGAGLSATKAAAVADLAAHVDRGVLDLGVLGRRGDDEVIAALVEVRGIGRWTAEMFLMNALRRPDVWPVTDYGVRLGWAYAHGLDAPPAPAQLEEDGERLRPHRSMAAWYCWREVEARRAFETP